MSQICGSISEYIHKMRTAFGTRFLILLLFTQCLLKGVLFVIMTTGMLPLFKSLGIDAVQLQMYGAIAMSPWTLKPAVGLISDLFPFLGYHKRYYMVSAVVFGVIGTVCMIGQTHNPVWIVVFVFCVHLCISVCDLLTEAAYARKMQEHPETGSSIVTLVQGYQQIGFLIALSFMGVLSDRQMFRVAYGIGLVCVVTPLLPLFWGWLPERRRHVWEHVLHRCRCTSWFLLDKERLYKDWKIVLLVGLTGLAGPLLGAMTAFVNEIAGLICAVLVLVAISIAGYKSFPRIIANVALYQILTQVSRISVGSALDYFFTADAECLPDGPNFDYQFYVTYTGLLGACISLITVFIYQLVFNQWRYRSVLIFTSILSASGGIFDFIMTMRWNIRWGIPDRYFYILGDGIIHDMVDMLYWLPSSSIIAKVCPHGMEAGVFSFLAGISNYGRMVSTLAGAQLIKWSGVKSTPHCHWDPLPWLILGGHILLMLCVSIPAAWLVPNILQTDAPMSSKVAVETETEETEDEIEFFTLTEDSE